MASARGMKVWLFFAWFQACIMLVLANSICILVILPLHYGSNTDGSQPLLRLGQKTLTNEILPGGLVAVESINNNTKILPGYQLSVEVIYTDKCSVNTPKWGSHGLLLKFVNSTLYQNNNISGVTGFLCHETVSMAFQSTNKSTLKATLSALILAQHSQDLMVQVVKAWFAFMNNRGWTQFGIITDITDSYSFHMAQLLLEGARKHSVAVSMNIQHCCATEIHTALPNIIFVSVNAQNAVQLVCSMYQKQQLWPKHVWVFHSNWYEKFLSEEINNTTMCDVTLALEGLILLRNQLRPDDLNSQLESGISYQNYYNQYTTKLVEIEAMFETSLKPNVYANRLHDLVLATALKLDNNYVAQLESFTFRGAQGIVKVNANGWVQTNINFIQVRDLDEICIAVFNISGELHFNDLQFEKNAQVYKPFIHVSGGSLAYTAGLAIEIMLGSLLTTFMLILFICFRKEPEVKSTSFILSLLMFLGCYLTLLYLSLLLHFDQSTDTLHTSHLHNLCKSQPWLSGLGIPLTLVLSVLIVKMLRVYHIFNRLVPGSVGKHCSDLFLMVYVMILLIPNIVIHIVWSMVDGYALSLEYTVFLTDAIKVKKQCVSQHFYDWLTVLVIYFALLLLVLLVVAIKSRKIRLMHFKDTKKVNALVFAGNVDLFLTLSYWLFLRGINAENHITHLPLHFGHSAFVFMCQILLFAPKLLPPLQRYFSKKVKT